MIELNGGLNLKKPDATFDLDGTVFKMTVLEAYVDWLSDQGLFDSIPLEINLAKTAWKSNNTEQTYTNHLNMLVKFFIEQVPGKGVEQLQLAAEIVAQQQQHRRWNVTESIIKLLRSSHNVMAVSMMPEWLMKPFVRDLEFVALIGSTYVSRDGQFTGEAHGINKAEAYLELRQGDSSKLDIHMGDTIGDKPLFDIARRPILFNPSGALLVATKANRPSVVISVKDTVTVSNPAVNSTQSYVAPFDVPNILSKIRTVRAD